MEEIYKKYSRIVYNYLYSLTQNIELSEELTQETFYSVINGIKNFKNECSINVWLCQIAKNKWKDYISKSKKLKLIPFDDTIEITLSDNNIEYSIDSKNEIIQLYKKIHELDEKTREVFYLRIKGELSFKEIGEILNKTEEWARITFYRGKIKLKEALNNEQKRM